MKTIIIDCDAPTPKKWAVCSKCNREMIGVKKSYANLCADCSDEEIE